MGQTAVLMLLYAANVLWFSAAFFQFSFRQRQAMSSGSLRAKSKDAKVRSTPEGDAWHHDLFAYLGGTNLALAVLAALRLVVLWKADLPGFSVFSTGSTATDVPLDVLSLMTLALGNLSQARVNFFVVRGTGRWIMGSFPDGVTTVDALLTVLDLAAVITVVNGRGLQ